MLSTSQRRRRRRFPKRASRQTMPARARPTLTTSTWLTSGETLSLAPRRSQRKRKTSRTVAPRALGMEAMGWRRRGSHGMGGTTSTMNCSAAGRTGYEDDSQAAAGSQRGDEEDGVCELFGPLQAVRLHISFTHPVCGSGLSAWSAPCACCACTRDSYTIDTALMNCVL